MPVTTVGQEWIFLGCLLAGLLMGLIYEAGFILRFSFTALFKESKTAPVPENAGPQNAPAKTLTAAAAAAVQKSVTVKTAPEQNKPAAPQKRKKTRKPQKQNPQKKAKAKTKSNKYFNAEILPSFIFSFIIDIIFFGACFLLVLWSAKFTADGQIFWFSVAAYIIGFILERITLGIIVAKFINMIYNTLARVLESLKKIKFFGKLFR